MQLGDLLTDERIRVPLEADTVERALQVLLADLGVEAGDAAPLLAAVSEGKGGEVLRPTPRTLLAVVRRADAEPAAALGVAPGPLGPGDRAPRVVLLLTLGPPLSVGERELAALARAMEVPAVEKALLSAEHADDVRSLRRLMGVTLSGGPKVRDALTPLSYRVYPDTPLDEVVDLMSRKGLSAVPVVGEGLQVLGVISAGEALRQALQGRPKSGGKRSAPTARDVMSRSIMCVTEDEDLDDAAHIMVNRDVAQLPVVREGEIVGFLTREAVLRSLFGERT
jgi:CBS domain-containing protein